MACIALLAMGLAGCDGGNGGTDAGPADSGPRPDSGPPPDGGPVDAGTDAGPADAGPPPGMFEVRLVNNVPGHEALDICLWASVTDNTVIPGTAEFLTQSDSVGPLPFRGVSPYVSRTLISGLNFVVGLYPVAPARITACPADPFAGDAPIAAVLTTIMGSAIPADSRVSGIATGYAPGTFGAAEDAYPSGERCGGGDCPQSQFLLVVDDTTEPASGQAHLRVSHQVPNAPVSFNICYHPGLVPDPTGGPCTVAVPDTAPTALFSNVGYEDVTDYSPTAPIQPTLAAMGVGGGIYLEPIVGPGEACATLEGPTVCLPILAAFPTAPPSDNIRPNLAEGDISTIFISGDFTEAGAYAPQFFIWQDNFAP